MAGVLRLQVAAEFPSAEQALDAEKPLLILGAPTPFVAMQMQHEGFKAGYLSGAGMSYFTHGIPDVGILGLDDVVHEIQKYRRVCDLPLLVDIDTGFDDPQKTLERIIEAGAAACHIEDQTEDKRCGHLDGKSIVSTDEMCARIAAAAKGMASGKKKDADFQLLARTDALAVEGFDAALKRIEKYLEAGATAIFAEAMTDLEHYRKIREVIGAEVPLLANMTEYGKTPLFSKAELATADVDMMLLPVSLNRAMHGMVWDWLEEIKETGTTQGLVDRGELRPRNEYSDLIDYDPKTDTRETVLQRLQERAK